MKSLVHATLYPNESSLPDPYRNASVKQMPSACHLQTKIPLLKALSERLIMDKSGEGNNLSH